LVQTLSNINEAIKQVYDMNNKHIKNTTYDVSLLGYATATFVPMAKPAVKNYNPEIRQDMTKTEANSRDRLNKRKRVYLHSIGRFSNLKKLQMGSYGD
jgi:hypothetical protein